MLKSGMGMAIKKHFCKIEKIASNPKRRQNQG